MYRARLQPTIDTPWLSMEPMIVGPCPTGAGTPAAYVTVERDGQPFARIDAYIEYGGGAFTELVTWGPFVVLGWGSVVHLIDPAAQKAQAIECDFYFAHLYPLDDRLLIATGTELICVDAQGKLLWKRPDLAVDGVVVERVENGIIVGSGEWDPPGDWRPFRLSLLTGFPIGMGNVRIKSIVERHDEGQR